MIEAEWRESTDPTPMLSFMRNKASDRKFRLLAVACCRRVWHLLDGEPWRKAVDIAQRFPDGGVGDNEYDAVFSECCNEYEEYGVEPFYEVFGGIDSQQPTQWEQANVALATLCAIVRFEV